MSYNLSKPINREELNQFFIDYYGEEFSRSFPKFVLTTAIRKHAALFLLYTDIEIEGFSCIGERSCPKREEAKIDIDWGPLTIYYYEDQVIEIRDDTCGACFSIYIFYR